MSLIQNGLSGRSCLDSQMQLPGQLLASFLPCGELHAFELAGSYRWQKLRAASCGSYATWISNCGRTLSGSAAIDLDGNITLFGRFGHVFRFHKSGIVEFFGVILTEGNKCLRVSYPDGWIRQFSYSEPGSILTEVRVRKANGQTYSHWLVNSNGLWVDGKKNLPLSIFSPEVSPDGSFSYFDNCGKKYLVSPDGTVSVEAS